MSEANIIKIDRYSGVALNEYDGKFSIQTYNLGSNEVWYLVWVFLSKWSKGSSKAVPDEKKRPMAVRIGDKATAIKTLQTLLKQLEAL